MVEGRHDTLTKCRVFGVGGSFFGSGPGAFFSRSHPHGAMPKPSAAVYALKAGAGVLASSQFPQAFTMVNRSCFPKMPEKGGYLKQGVTPKQRRLNGSHPKQIDSFLSIKETSCTHCPQWLNEIGSPARCPTSHPFFGFWLKGFSTK